jgi:sulfur relay (sulfurtransferase) DsrF/TusC family protein
VLSDKRCQRFIEYLKCVLDVINKVADPVYQFVKKCAAEALTAINLPRALESIFKSFKKYVIHSCYSLASSWYHRELDTVKNAFKHMSLVEAICFVAWYSLRKAKKSADNVLKLLERFQVRRE